MYTSGYARQTNIDVSGRTLRVFPAFGDEGLTWERPVLLSNVEQSTTERPSIAVDLFGNVYAGWITFSPHSNTSFFIRRSTDGGASFGPIIALSPVVIVPSPLPVPGYEFRCLTWPNLAADTSLNLQTSNTLYAVWQDYRLGYADIFMSKSRDQGITWSSPVKVTDSPAGSQNFFPAIDVSPKTGAIKIIYYTNKLSGFFLDVFVAESNNGGNTFVNSTGDNHIFQSERNECCTDTAYRGLH